MLVIDLAAYTSGGFDHVAFLDKAKDVTASAATAKVVVIDLRGAQGWLAGRADFGPTHGANTALRLPGKLRMWSPGRRVRHVDGKQLQNVGAASRRSSCASRARRARPTLAQRWHGSARSEP